MARKKEIRKLREPIPTIIGAGITEKWYFRHLKDYAHLKLDIKPKYFGSDTAYDMQKFVEGVLAIGGKAICIFDMDTTQWDDVEKERKTQFIAAYQKNPNVILCGSMPSVEYWFLLHFEKSNRHFGTSDKVIEALEHYMPFEKKEKFLSKPQWILPLLSKNRTEQAMINADELGTTGASYTEIPKVLRFLNINNIRK